MEEEFLKTKYPLGIISKIYSGIKTKILKIYNIGWNKNELIGLIAQSQNRNPKLWNISKGLIEGVAYLGDKLHLPLNTERLHKLTSSYVVGNAKIKAAIGKPLPVSSSDGLLMTFKSFNNK